ncbi:MAG: nucleoside deaminase [Nitrococcus sp.]|nr:nucleoside deaminase [Nitrococcus sp.]
MDHAAFMRRAIELSHEKMNAGVGGPFGAVIVRNDGTVIAEGWNRVWSAMDPTAHAEMVAIRRACRALGTYYLADCSIYTSCEPCPMCLGAIYWARLQVIYYANTRTDAAAIGFDDSFVYDEIARPPSERSVPALRLLGDEAAAVFQAWQEKADKTVY